jgi:hypothetical protein
VDLVEGEGFGFNALSCAVDLDIAVGPSGTISPMPRKLPNFLAVALSPCSTPPAVNVTMLSSE